VTHPALKYSTVYSTAANWRKQEQRD